MFLLYEQKVRKINETVKPTLVILRENFLVVLNPHGGSKYNAHRKINKNSQK